MSIDKHELLAAAAGRWDQILGTLMPVSDTLQMLGRSQHGQCPFPDRHHRSGGQKKFRFRMKDATFSGAAICTCGSWSDGMSLLMDYRGWSFPQALEEINQCLGDPAQAHHCPKSRPITHASNVTHFDAKRRQALNRTWAKALALSDNAAAPARVYVQNRGIDPDVIQRLRNVRYHPLLALWEDGIRTGSFPALIGRLHDAQGKPATLHRIYITAQGHNVKLNGKSCKKMMVRPSTHRVMGGAIRLMTPDRILALTEGVETAFAVIEATGLPTWSCYSASLLAGFSLESLPGQIDQLVIFADKDVSQAGEQAATQLAENALALGLDCRIMLPSQPIPPGEKSLDWNDVLRVYGRSGFPKLDQRPIGQHTARLGWPKLSFNGRKRA